MVRREIHYRPSLGQKPKLRDLPVRRQWDWLSRFFSRCTDSTPFAAGATLQVIQPPPGRDRHVLDSAVAEAIRLFGTGKYEADVAHPEEGRWEWPIAPDQEAAVIEFLARGEPWALHGLRPAHVYYLTRFHLQDPATGRLLTHQLPPAPWSLDRTSHVIGAVGPYPWLKPYFVFPFPRVTDRFLKFLAAFSAELPFRMAPRHFRSVRQASEEAREHIGFLSPEDDERIRRAQLRPRVKAASR